MKLEVYVQRGRGWQEGEIEGSEKGREKKRGKRQRQGRGEEELGKEGVSACQFSAALDILAEEPNFE